jgi:hypothetical protein
VAGDYVAAAGAAAPRGRQGPYASDLKNPSRNPE